MLSNKALKCIWNVFKQFLLCSLFRFLTLCFASDSCLWCQFPIWPKGIPESTNVVNQHLLAEYPVHGVPDLLVDGSSKRDLNESNQCSSHPFKHSSKLENLPNEHETRFSQGILLPIHIIPIIGQVAVLFYLLLEDREAASQAAGHIPGIAQLNSSTDPSCPLPLCPYSSTFCPRGQPDSSQIQSLKEANWSLGAGAGRGNTL